MNWIRLIKADLESKKPYLLKDLEKSNIDKNEYDKIIETCNNADPTGDRAVYTQWILRQYLNNNFKGEEDIDKFKDILTKFTKLKNSKKIQPADLNQYKSFAELTEKVNNVLNESGGYTSKREEETTKTEEGIKKIDQDGNIELFVVNTPEAASKEFRNTEWCVRDPRWFKQYAGTDSNFYYFKKDGEPYLLLHKKDFRDVYDGKPDNENLQDVAKLMIKHNLPNQYTLISRGIITEENKELFDRAVNQAIKDGYSYRLLDNKIITEKNKEWFDKLVDQAIENGEATNILYSRILTKEKNKELFDKAVNWVIENERSYWLITRKIITKEDGKVFDKAVNKTIKDGDGYFLLIYEIITKEKNKELFDQLVNQTIETDNEYLLLYHKIITEEELEKYKNNSKKQASLNSKWIRVI